MTETMPVVFVGHGSPMNAIEDNEYSRGWRALAAALPRPRGIVCISAHWETRGLGVTAMERPRTIYDFYGFPDELYARTYPAPGDPALAQEVRRLIKSGDAQLDLSWGLDHGTWSVLCQMYPQADIPVLQLSLDRNRDAAYHYRVGQELAALREQGILILGSGNIVHNLRLIQWREMAYDWAVEFDQQAADWITAGDHAALVAYEKAGRAADLSINSAEHYLPLLYVLGAGGTARKVSFVNERVSMGSMSMRCVVLS
jgi:4,5-DOPA dioxygenase extradiol